MDKERIKKQVSIIKEMTEEYLEGHPGLKKVIDNGLRIIVEEVDKGGDTSD